MKITLILIIASLFTFNQAATLDFTFEKIPHFFFKFLEGFELSDRLANTKVCNDTATILFSDFFVDLHNIMIYQDHASMVKFGKTLG